MSSDDTLPVDRDTTGVVTVTINRPHVNNTLDVLERLPVPVIAAINGYAVGGGCGWSGMRKLWTCWPGTWSAGWCCRARR